MSNSLVPELLAHLQDITEVVADYVPRVVFRESPETWQALRSANPLYAVFDYSPELDAERETINLTLGQEHVDHNLSRRRDVVERKLEGMRTGRGDWYLYRYLGAEGFLPGYAFPPQATALSFDAEEEELSRSLDIALSEYTPGNFVYYHGERYEVTHARPRRRRVDGSDGRSDTELDIEPVLISHRFILTKAWP